MKFLADNWPRCRLGYKKCVVKVTCGGTSRQLLKGSETLKCFTDPLKVISSINDAKYIFGIVAVTIIPLSGNSCSQNPQSTTMPSSPVSSNYNHSCSLALACCHPLHITLSLLILSKPDTWPGSLRCSSMAGHFLNSSPALRNTH